MKVMVDEDKFDIQCRISNSINHVYKSIIHTVIAKKHIIMMKYITNFIT